MDTLSSTKSTYWRNFSNRLRALLKEQGIRQNAFASQLDVGPTAVNNWLKRKKVPSANRLLEIADILAVPLDALFDRTPPKKKKTIIKKKAKSTKKKTKKKKSKRKTKKK